jgi:GTP:adenosylcobinamide-phosphate guanylyltransferase
MQGLQTLLARSRSAGGEGSRLPERSRPALADAIRRMTSPAFAALRAIVDRITSGRQ